MDSLNLNLFNVVIFLGILQGVIFSFVVFLYKRYKSKTNNFIALTVLMLSLSNLQYWIMDVGLKGFFEIFNDLRIPCDVLILPAFFLYVNSYLQKRNNNKLIILLSIPFLLSLIFSLITFINKSFFSTENLITLNITLEIISLLLNLVLIILIFYKIRLYEKENKVHERAKVKVETKWLKQILIIGGILCLFWTLEILYVQRENNIGLSVYYPLWISISFLIYWISYVGIFHSKVYSDRKLIRELSTALPLSNIKSNQKKTNDKLLNEIFQWIIEEKEYLNPDLSLHLVAKEFKISKGYLSQLISSHSELNFNNFINKLRVESSKKMLSNNQYDNYTILAIGLEAGFNSKSSFYTAFKKFTGITPQKYKISPK